MYTLKRVILNLVFWITYRLKKLVFWITLGLAQTPFYLIFRLAFKFCKRIGVTQDRCIELLEAGVSTRIKFEFKKTV